MTEFLQPIYEALYQKLTLQAAGFAVGLFLVLTHLWGWLKADAAKAFAVSFPRNQSAGTVVLTVAAILAASLVSSVDLGEFAKVRHISLWAIPVVYVAMLFYVNDYLGARALGILAVLVATPLLDAAFLQPPGSRLFLTGLVYVWILLGMFWIGMPYCLRDQIQWATATSGRWKALCIAGIAYGGLLLFLAGTAWGGLGRLAYNAGL